MKNTEIEKLEKRIAELEKANSDLYTCNSKLHEIADNYLENLKKIGHEHKDKCFMFNFIEQFIGKFENVCEQTTDYPENH